MVDLRWFVLIVLWIIYLGVYIGTRLFAIVCGCGFGFWGWVVLVYCWLVWMVLLWVWIVFADCVFLLLFVLLVGGCVNSVVVICFLYCCDLL